MIKRLVILSSPRWWNVTRSLIDCNHAKLGGYSGDASKRKKNEMPTVRWMEWIDFVQICEVFVVTRRDDWIIKLLLGRRFSHLSYSSRLARTLSHASVAMAGNPIYSNISTHALRIFNGRGVRRAHPEWLIM